MCRHASWWESNGLGKTGKIHGLVICYSLLLKMAIEIVKFPMTHGDFPYSYVSLPEGIFVAQAGKQRTMRSKVQKVRVEA